MNDQDHLRWRKVDDLEQCGRLECLHFDGFEVSDAESTANYSKIVKDYIKKQIESRVK